MGNLVGDFDQPKIRGDFPKSQVKASDFVGMEQPWAISRDLPSGYD